MTIHEPQTKAGQIVKAFLTVFMSVQHRKYPRIAQEAARLLHSFGKGDVGATEATFVQQGKAFFKAHGKKMGSGWYWAALRSQGKAK